MFERYSDPARSIVAVAGEEARQLGHQHIGTEHLLLGLLSDQDNSASQALPPGTTVQVVRHKVAEAVGSNGATTDDDLSFTPRAKRALERASRFSLQRHDDEVEIVHVLLGVLDVEGRAGQVLRGVGVDVGRLRDAAERSADPPRLSLDLTTPLAAPRLAPAVSTAVAPRLPLSPPHCSECGAALDASLAWRLLAAHNETGDKRPFLVAYCSACGSALGGSPADSTQ